MEAVPSGSPLPTQPEHTHGSVTVLRQRREAVRARLGALQMYIAQYSSVRVDFETGLYPFPPRFHSVVLAHTL